MKNDDPVVVLARRVAKVRHSVRLGDPLPAWTPEQWIAVAVIKLGQAASSLHSEVRTPETTVIGVEQLLAVAAVCMDAVEALEREPGAEETV